MTLRFETALKYVTLGLAAIVLVALAVAPFTKSLIEQWSRDDVEERSRLVYYSIYGPVVRAIADQAQDRLGSILEGVAQDERILGLGLCDAAGKLVSPTKLMPRTFSCEKVARSEAESFSSIVNDGRKVLVGSFPIVDRAQKAYLVVLHDVTFVDARSGEAQAFLVATLAGVVITVVGAASIVAVLAFGRWMRSLQQAVADLRFGGPRLAAGRERSAIDMQIQGLPRAGSAHDPGAVAQVHDHHLLAHPLAERRDFRHLSLEGEDHRRPARKHDSRIPYPIPLQ
jgi:trehalose 6-phosphate synthase